jgi:tetratricopeptide (TPR) repeat protein
MTSPRTPPLASTSSGPYVPPLPGQAPAGGGFAMPPKSNVSNRPAGARRIVEVASGGADARAGDADARASDARASDARANDARASARPGARDLTRDSQKVASVALEVVTLDDGSAAHQTLVGALVMDDYAPLVARHGLEALVLILRKAPVLAIVPERARGLAGHIIVDEVRKRRELDGTTLVLIDDGAAPVPDGAARVVRWPGVPDDVTRVRGAIDRLLAETSTPGGAPSRPAVHDARSLAEAMAALANNLEDRGLLDEASAALRYAGELAPTVTTHALRLARLLLARGEERGPGAPAGTPRADEAQGLVERSIRLEPLSVDALILRALIVDGRGNKELARAALKRAQMLAPQHAEVTSLMARLDAGQPLDDRANAVENAAATANDEAPAGTPAGALGRLRKLFG